MTASTTLTPAPGTEKRTGWPLAIALIASVFILTCGALGFYVIRGMLGLSDKVASIPDSIGKNLANSLSPQLTFTTQINSAIGAIRHTPKLIVNTYEIDVEIEKSVTSTWAYIYWGTTQVSVRARKNKIQYFIPVDNLSTSSFSYDADHKILHAIIPLPRIDEDVVEVQSDPNLLEMHTSVGWASTDSGAGQSLRQEALTQLRTAVINAGKGEAQQALAEKDARKNFTRLLDPVVQAMGGDVKVMIDFEPPPSK